MFIFLLPGYLNRPADKPRFWYLLLLGLLIVYNISGGLLPNPKYDIPLYVQNIIAYGTGFLMASYFPLFFYKAFNLKLLRFHAFYGVPIFLLAPYLLFFVVSYSINKDLTFAVKYGIIVPFFYSFILLWAIFRAIRVNFNRKKRTTRFHIEQVAAYSAVVPWAATTVISYFGFGQLIEVLLTNSGFLAVTVIFICKFIQEDRNAIAELEDVVRNGITPELFTENCAKYQFTAREIEVVKLLHHGHPTSEIAYCLHIAERTVTTHIHNMMSKTNTHSRLELLRALERGKLIQQVLPINLNQS
jgi:DNA-binding CsgD family transcriptional regulator